MTVTTTHAAAAAEHHLHGGFEGSASPWTVSSGVWCSELHVLRPRPRTAAPASCGWTATARPTRTPRRSRSRSLTGKTSASLTFYLHIDTAETTKSTAYDTLTVGVTSGSTTTTVGTYSNLNAASGYVLKTISLNAYIGKTVTLKFTGKEDSSAQTSFVLDDVAVTTN